jgi:CDP-paratose 2-epimerase
MRICITGICGFVGASLARFLKASSPDLDVFGVDNLSRAGSETNLAPLAALGVRVVRGDLRLASDLDALPGADWVIDAAANPSVLAGVGAGASSRQLVEHNLVGTLNLLEYCKRHRAGLLLLSTSRVYSIPVLAALPMREESGAFTLDATQALPPGVSVRGIAESFSTQAPVSLYGATKLASEQLALEYGAAFEFPVWINRCGVLAGAGQFGRADQGIFSFWLHAWKSGAPLAYIGFGGRGSQVRDAFHPDDLGRLLVAQMKSRPENAQGRVFNVGGGLANSLSLTQLSGWCAQRFGPREVTASPASRPYDLPWVVMDSSLVEDTWDWRPQIPLTDILEQIAQHAERHPDWLARCSV